MESRRDMFPRIGRMIAQYLASVLAIGCVVIWPWQTSAATLPALPEGFQKRTFTEISSDFWQSADTFSLRVHIKNGTRSQHFRLYGINAPEPDDTRPEDLIKDSARFRLPPEQILRWGDHARQTVHHLLSTGGTIYTKRLPADRVMDRQYTYAIVFDSQGRDLSQYLVQSGLAVVDAQTHPSHAETIQRSEQVAMRSRVGIWSLARDSIPALPLTKVPAPSSSSSQIHASSDPLPILNDKPWIIYQEGVFAPNFYTPDGDSFAISARVSTGTRRSTKVWRLYAVDTPESDLQIPERVRRQAKYFGVDTQTVMTYGRKASHFAAKFLTSGPATIYTFHENARGVTSKNRYYAIVRVHDQDLGLSLVREGLALSGSMPLPSKGSEAQRYRRMLDSAEREARQQKRGIWQHSR